MLSEHTLRGNDGGLPAPPVATALPHLRGLRPRDRLDVQPSTQMDWNLHPPRHLATPRSCLGTALISFHGLGAPGFTTAFTHRRPGPSIENAGSRQQEAATVMVKRVVSGGPMPKPACLAGAEDLPWRIHERCIATSISFLTSTKHLQYLTIRTGRASMRGQGHGPLSWRQPNDDPPRRAG